MKPPKLIIPMAAFLALIPKAMAHCPLCTAAVGGAAVAAKFYGFDLSIIGLFIGAFGVSTGLWVGRKIKKRIIPLQVPAIVLASFLLTVIPLLSISGENFYYPIFWGGDPGTAFNKIYWIDRMLVGSIIGALASLGAFWLHGFVKRRNSNKVLFPYQGIALTVGVLAVIGGILFFATGGLKPGG